MADDDVLGPGRKKPARLPPEVLKQIGLALGRRPHVDIASEPIPERFVELLKKLDQKESKD